jgi:CTP:molybdopterin cytidylyltransferase MocA
MPEDKMTPILLLAAGRSSRMGGQDKLALPVSGTPLLRDRALTALATGEPVFVVLPSSRHPRAALISGLPATVVSASDAALGLAHTLRTAVAALPPCDRFLILLADLPEITTDDLRSVLTAPAAYPDSLIWRGATSDGAPGHPVLFDASLRPAFATLDGDTGAEPIIRAHRADTTLIPLPGQHARRDLDTPADWAGWRAETGR